MNQPNDVTPVRKRRNDQSADGERAVEEAIVEMDVQHPCVRILQGKEKKVCKQNWDSCWTMDKCVEIDISIDEVEIGPKFPIYKIKNNPKSNFNINTLYLPMFLFAFYLNVNSSNY